MHWNWPKNDYQKTSVDYGRPSGPTDQQSETSQYSNSYQNNLPFEHVPSQPQGLGGVQMGQHQMGPGYLNNPLQMRNGSFGDSDPLLINGSIGAPNNKSFWSKWNLTGLSSWQATDSGPQGINPNGGKMLNGNNNHVLLDPMTGQIVNKSQVMVNSNNLTNSRLNNGVTSTAIPLPTSTSSSHYQDPYRSFGVSGAEQM